MTNDLEAKIQEMVRRIVEAVHPDRVVLFGSRARGEAGPDSDVDLLMIAPSEAPSDERTVPLCQAIGVMGVSKDLIRQTPEGAGEWRNVRSHFLTRVMREGKVLYERAA
jgi:predicted nucleotidyltransferase